MQPGERLAIGNSQTTLEDRLQPSLTASSMFNAVHWVGEVGAVGGVGVGPRLPPSRRRSALECVWLEGDLSDVARA